MAKRCHTPAFGKKAMDLTDSDDEINVGGATYTYMDDTPALSTRSQRRRRNSAFATLPSSTGNVRNTPSSSGNVRKTASLGSLSKAKSDENDSKEPPRKLVRQQGEAITYPKYFVNQMPIIRKKQPMITFDEYDARIKKQWNRMIYEHKCLYGPSGSNKPRSTSCTEASTSADFKEIELPGYGENLPSSEGATQVLAKKKAKKNVQTPQQMVSDPNAIKKCARKGCKKRAVINPNWGNEYCSKECTDRYCRNAFESWVDPETSKDENNC